MINVLQIVAAPCKNKVGFSINGPERRSANLVSKWSKLGILPCIVYPKRGRCWSIFEKSGVPLEDYEIGGKFNYSAVGHFCELIRRFNCSVVHTQGPPSVDLFAARACKQSVAKLVVTRPLMVLDRSGWKGPMYDLLDRYTLRTASRMISVSQAGQKYLETKRALNNKLTLIYNGVDLSQFETASCIGDGLIEIGMVAQLTPIKGWGDFIDVIGNLRTQGWNVRGHVVGDGPLRTQMEKLAASRGLAEHVKFEGFQGHVGSLLRGWSIFLFTSHLEGLSVAILEAMASGLPVVATDVGGTREQVVDGINGFVHRAGDIDGLTRSCAKLCEDVSLRQKMGRESRLRAEEHFSEERMLAAHARLYRELAGEPKAPV